MMQTDWTAREDHWRHNYQNQLSSTKVAPNGGHTHLIG